MLAVPLAPLPLALRRRLSFHQLLIERLNSIHKQRIGVLRAPSTGRGDELLQQPSLAAAGVADEERAESEVRDRDGGLGAAPDDRAKVHAGGGGGPRPCRARCRPMWGPLGACR